MAEMTQEEMVQEVLDRVLQSSTGVEDLETVTSLNGVKSLPGEKDGKMVIVPLELIGKPASDAAARAEAAAKKAEGAVAGLEEKTQAATEAATKANEAAAKAENAAAKVEQTTAAAVGGATVRFSSWMETGNVLPDKVPSRAAAWCMWPVPGNLPTTWTPPCTGTGTWREYPLPACS